MTGGVAGVYVPEEENEYAGVVVPEEDREPGMEGRFYSTISKFPALPFVWENTHGRQYTSQDKPQSLAVLEIMFVSRVTS